MSSVKRKIRLVHVVVVQKRAEKCTKQHGARAKLFFSNQTYCFFNVLVAVRVVGS